MTATTIIFNEHNLPQLKDFELKRLQTLYYEFINFNNLYNEIAENIKPYFLNLKTKDSIFSININIQAGFTFSSHLTFLSSCTILRPFILNNENYYAKSKNLINVFFGCSKEKNTFITSTINKHFPLLHEIKTENFSSISKHHNISNFFTNNNTNNKIYNVLKPCLNESFHLELNNYEFFNLYLNAFIYHRDEKIIDFICETLNMRYLQNPDFTNPDTNELLYPYYSICIKILNFIHKISELIIFIYNYLNNNEHFQITFFNDTDCNFSISKL